MVIDLCRLPDAVLYSVWAQAVATHQRADPNHEMHAVVNALRSGFAVAWAAYTAPDAPPPWVAGGRLKIGHEVTVDECGVVRRAKGADAVALMQVPAPPGAFLVVGTTATGRTAVIGWSSHLDDGAPF
jgi:hypothetical protein